MNRYYVYAYLDSKMIPYYIGKGTGDRWRQAHSCGVPKDDNRIAIIEDNLTELEALDLEEKLIEEYWSLLANVLPGGRDHAQELFRRAGNTNKGKKRPEWVREKIRQGQLSSPNHSTRGKKRPEFAKKQSAEGNPFYGRKHSEETKEKMREAKRK